MKCANHPEIEAAGACVECGKLFCKDCLVEVDGRNYCKTDLAKVVQGTRTGQQAHQSAQPNINITNVNTATANATVGGTGVSTKSRWVAFFLCLFLGWAGIHRFYVAKVGTGIIWLFTVGFFGIGWLIDLLVILFGGFRDKLGLPLRS